MPVLPPKIVAGEEPTYTRSVFEAILSGMGLDDDRKSHFDLSEDGARVKNFDKSEWLTWHPSCEVMTPGSPNSEARIAAEIAWLASNIPRLGAHLVRPLR